MVWEGSSGRTATPYPDYEWWKRGIWQLGVRGGDPASPFDEKGICRQALDVRSQKLHTPLLGWGFSWRNTARNAAGFRGGADFAIVPGGGRLNGESVSTDDASKKNGVFRKCLTTSR